MDEMDEVMVTSFKETFTKIKEELQWQPQYTEIKDIIASAWQWQKNNPQGFAK